MDKKNCYCKINGTIYDLRYVQEVLGDENKVLRILMYTYGFETLEAMLITDVITFNNNEIPADYDECLERMREYNSRNHSKTPTIKCPVCGSPNVGPLSTTLRLLGAFSLGRCRAAWCQFQCNHCGYMW